jgi:hypothetical protein
MIYCVHAVTRSIFTMTTRQYIEKLQRQIAKASGDALTQSAVLFTRHTLLWRSYVPIEVEIFSV